MTAPTIAQIQRAVAAAEGLPVEIMWEERGCGAASRERSHPRQEAMYLARRLTRHSLPVIGKHFGNRDHTTVLDAFVRVQHRVFRERDTEARLAAIIDQLVGLQ